MSLYEDRPACWDWLKGHTWSGRLWVPSQRIDNVFHPGHYAPYTLTEAELYAVWQAIPTGKEAILTVLSVETISHPKANKALQLLRQHNLASYDVHTRTWHQENPT